MSFVCLRKDINIDLKNNAVKLIKVHKNAANETLLYISKSTAIVLSLLDGTKTVKQIVNMLSSLFDISLEKSENIICNIFETYLGQLEFSSIPMASRPILKTEDIIKCTAVSPTKYLSTIVRRKIQRLVLFITNDCAAKCIYCCIGNSIKRHTPTELSLAQIKNLLFQAKELKIPEVEITGGDPLVHSDIIPILELAINYGFVVFISTKIPISYTISCNFYKIGLKHISLSLDTIDPNIYEQIVGLDRKYLNKTLDGIKYLSMQGINYTIKITITSLNIQQIPNMIKFLHSEYSCKHIMLQAYSRGDCYIKQLFADKEAYIVLDAKINEIIESNTNLNITKAYNLEKIISTKKFLHMSRMICMAGKNAINVYPTGRYGFCAHSLNDKLTYGDILKEQA